MVTRIETIPATERTQSPPARRGQWRLPVTCLVLVFAFAWYADYRGIDFGYHWDEQRLTDAVAEAAGTQLLLPRWYNYPSLSFDLALAALAPDVISSARLPAHVAMARLSEIATQHRFLIRVRALFMTITLLAGILIFIMTRAAGGGRWTALFASAIALTSWEIGYHARWLAPDGPAMTLSALTAALLLISRHRSARQRWVRIAAVAAGLACAAKYPAGAALILVLVVAIADRWSREKSVRQNLNPIARQIGVVFLLFGATFLCTTPGLAVEPVHFFRDVVSEIRHYKYLGHGGNNTFGFADHLTQNLRYMFVAALSPYRVPAALMAGLFLIGAANIWRGSRLTAFIILFLPVFLPLYFATQKVMVVRNLLPVIPFMCVLAALGVEAIFRRLLIVRFGNVVVGVFCVALVLPGAVWSMYAANTIVYRNSRQPVQELEMFLASHPNWRFVVSARVASELGKAPTTQPLPDTSSDGPEWVVFHSSEAANNLAWPANRVNYRLLASGPYEVNWRYYPGWHGDDRIVLAPLKQITNTPLASILALPQPSPN